jgi:hypothetical protein
MKNTDASYGTQRLAGNLPLKMCKELKIEATPKF